ncbi:cryptochrome, DASH family [Aequorivita sublithincola DSM 14238]|uniref:Cryptochrome DASH n=1 Tax=Aequorivita sublithincola (strain DSM 14238 / LMG 21431 / ACAM 643 / 9-3) TaxID=746697 RepID=I3Z000_AEQSU|nr:DASH family cryptochrome [Aequorivita sublithincola]AFL82568.1 cryptochrome, DASH family [Aequorivita sublithincola DSM 14238]
MKDVAIKKATALMWFKNDLRLHDNEALCNAIACNLPVIYLYCIDSRIFKSLNLGFRKADANRAIFLKQSLEDLQIKLEELGGHLIIEYGIPEDIIASYVTNYTVKQIYAEEEYAWEELQMMKKVEKLIDGTASLTTFWGKTLYHKDDIPFEISKIPLTSKAYRIPTGNQSTVREPLKEPSNLNAYDEVKSTEFPEFKILGFNSLEILEADPYVAGGESAGIDRLHYYTFETEQLTGYRWSRNKSLGMDYSSKFSPYLALGCVSPRFIYQQVKHYEEIVKKNQSTWWLVFELVWRDYFTFKGMRIGNSIFKTKGFSKKTIEFENNIDLFKRWCWGTTGIPFVDAHMRQLNKTGYISNRGRVNCASFLVHDYKVDWTWGAAYFESKLIDYDVSANWLNWHMQAYEIWYTNPIHQSLKYKSKKFIQTWIPELSHIDDNHIYLPWREESKEYNTKAYPEPIEIFSKWNRSISNILKQL